MGFFNIYKPRKYDYRYIYYDPKKEAQKEREKQLAEDKPEGEYKSSIQRGSFRAEASKNKNSRSKQTTISNIRLVLILFVLLLIAYFLLK